MLLYGFEKEIKETTCAIPRRPYLVIYAYGDRLNTPEEITAIRTFAKQHHLQVISPGFYHKWADKNLQVTPLELLKVIQGARFVITDTFHGCVISALLNRPFAVLIRNSNRNKISYLLDSLGLQTRSAGQLEQLATVLAQPIDWQVINGNITRLRAEGLDYLKGVLNE